MPFLKYSKARHSKAYRLLVFLIPLVLYQLGFPQGSTDFLLKASVLKAGETLVIPDGTYADCLLKIKGKGTKENKITVKAETPGKVILTKGSQIEVDGEYIEVSGIKLLDGGIPQDKGHAITVLGKYNRITDCAIVDFNLNNKGKQWVSLFGQFHRFDHNWLEGKTTVDPTLQIEVDEKEAPQDLIDHNYFGHRNELPDGANGGETMRIGYSGQAYFSAKCRVVSNLFEACNGEIEIISVKSCDNQIAFNTFLKCAGAITLRHGTGSTVEGNFILAQGTKDSGGVRVIGANHLIKNNLIYQCAARMGGAINLTASQVDFKPSGYWTVSNVTIEQNVIVETLGPALHLSSMFGGKGGSQTVLPSDISLRNNQFHNKTGAVILGTRGANLLFDNNEVWGDVTGLSDLKGLNLHSETINFDLEKYYQNIGRRPLVKKEVGPSWM